MGSSSSRPQYYHPQPSYAQPGYPTQGQPAYLTQGRGQFGYYMQQVGSDPAQVQAIPGYYYPQQDVRNRPAHKKHRSAPTLSTLPQTGDPASAPSAEAPAPPTQAPVEPAGQSEALPEAPPEASAPANERTEPPQGPSNPTAAPAPAPMADQPGLTNPLPRLPRDVFDTEPYRHLRRTQTSGTTGSWRYYAAPIASVSYNPQLRSQYRSKGKEAKRPPRPHAELMPKVKKSRSGGPFKMLRSLTMPSLSTNKIRKGSRPSLFPYAGPPQPYEPSTSTSESRGTIPMFPPVPVPVPSAPSGPPITVPLSSPLNPTSLHKILYKKKLYPTAAHLFEAQKFLKHRPELAERIRTSSDSAVEMSVLSRAFQADGMVRKDWQLVWRDKMDEVLYMKFTQHPDLRAELMATGSAPLLDGNEIRQPDGEGVNELGKALVRLRERLRREGAR